jgi:preprotein translocase subunit YajC
MKTTDIENLKVGDRVRHTDGTAGTITDVGYCAATIV